MGEGSELFFGGSEGKGSSIRGIKAANREMEGSNLVFLS